MIVPELPADIRELKARVGRFVEEEVYPIEGAIAERGSIDPQEVEELRRKGGILKPEDIAAGGQVRGDRLSAPQPDFGTLNGT